MTIRKNIARGLFAGTLFAALTLSGAALSQTCPKNPGDTCRGHGGCSPPANGVCTDTTTDCVCQAKTSQGIGALLSHVTIGVGAASNHRPQTGRGATPIQGPASPGPSNPPQKQQPPDNGRAPNPNPNGSAPSGG